MIEILLLIKLADMVVVSARQQRRKAWPYVVMLVVFWFLGEFLASLLATIILLFLGYKPEQEFLWIYIIALFGAAFGAWMAFLLAQRPGTRQPCGTCLDCGERLTDLSYPCPACGSFRRGVDGENPETQASSI